MFKIIKVHKLRTYVILCVFSVCYNVTVILFFFLPSNFMLEVQMLILLNYKLNDNPNSKST